MPLIDLRGVPDDGVATIPQSLVFACFLIPFLPGMAGAEETDLGNGRTQVSVDFGGSVISVIVRDYVSGPYGDPPRETIIGGTIEEASVTGEREQRATDLGIDVATFLPIVAGYLDGTDPDGLTRETLGLGWEIRGRGQADVLQWTDVGFDEDLLFSGDDRFLGLGGNDVISLYDGNDTGIGGRGNDVIRGGRGQDTLLGNGGRDRLFGDAGNDTLNGGGGADALRGGGGNDTLLGGSARDTLVGQGGNDRLLGGGGNDRLIGNGARDVLEGGGGADRMTGGRGIDTFVFRAGSGHDTITDYAVDQDRIRLVGVDGVSLEATDTGVLLTHSGGSVTLLGVALDDIDTGDILGW